MGKYDKLKKALNWIDEVPTVEAQKALRASDPAGYAEYLKALDGEYGDRAKRAADMGFGKKTWYHGTNVPIDEFKKDALGLSTGAQSAKKGFFFAKDPETASQYADLANEHGVIREGDKVTTKYLSDTAEIPEKLGYNHYGDKRNEWNNLMTRKEQEAKRLKSVADWDLIAKNPPEWMVKTAQREGKSIPQVIAEKTSRLREPIKQASKKEVEAARQEYFKSLREFTATNEPHYAQKILSHDLERMKDGPERQAILDAIKHGEDLTASGGQNVLPVRLKGNPLVKNYKGESYRDETYADMMKQATDEGHDSVLFKNTYDAADPNNKVKTDIATVFDPNQVRSTSAAFDPRFKDSSDLLSFDNAKAGAGKVMDALSYPQRWAMNKGAELMGVKGNPDNSEESAFNIVDKGASALGIPEDSAIGNAGKAAAVAGLEVFGDPTNAIPTGAIAKGARKLAPALNMSDKYGRLLKMFGK